MQKLFYFLLILLLGGLSYSQNPKVIDSLLIELSRPKADSNNICFKIGQYFFTQGQYSVSANYYTIALNNYERKNDIVNTAPILNEMGNIYLQHQKDFEKAKEYYEKAHKIYLSQNNKHGIALTYNNIGISYLSMGKYEIATEYLLKSYDIKLEINDTLSIFKTLNNLGELYYMQEDYERSIIYYQKSLDANSTNIWSYANTLNNIAKYYITIKNYPIAESNLNKAEQIALDNSFHFILKENYQLYTQLYSKQNKLVSLDKYNKLYLSISDSLYNEKSLRLLTETQIKYETKKKENENELLKAENEIKNQILIVQNNKIIGLVIGVLIFVLSALIFLYQMLAQQKANKLLVSKNFEIIEREKELKTIKHQLELELKNIKKGKDITSEKEKYSSSELKKEKKEELINAINELIMNKKSHLNSSFSLKQMSEEINSSRTFVSQIINEHYNCNFNVFVNNYRIKEAMIILSDPAYKNITIEAIANKVGFKSKSTFNSAFKQFTGITPSFYLKTIKGTFN